METKAAEVLEPIRYCESLTSYKRRQTLEVNIGEVPLGGDQPIRVQSMTTVDTMDTAGSVEQAIRMVESGCEYVRITAPSVKEAENLRNIRDELRKRNIQAPLVADIHFTPNAAELAAKIVEKVRVNPGNYADKKKFEEIEYTDEAYQDELLRIEQKFTPLINICKEHGTAMRIGTNHGSLSDRIMSRYGDTPIGMVESALEFIRICEKNEYYDLVISMKSSNPQVMVQAYRLLVQKLEEEGLKPYPLHLGVTEAGEAEDGRIKSALGIGTLLEDGLGDTVRVSLTEAPEVESPVGRILVDRFLNREEHQEIDAVENPNYNPFEYSKRGSLEVLNIGDTNVPRVIADFSKVENLEMADLKNVGHFYLPALDKWTMSDLGTDFIYTGTNPVSFMLPNGLKEIVDHAAWVTDGCSKSIYPLLETRDLGEVLHPELNFVRVDEIRLSNSVLEALKGTSNMVLMLTTRNTHAMAALRNAFFKLDKAGVKVPVIIERVYPQLEEDAMMMFPATDIGGLLIDGFGDGCMITTSQFDSQDHLFRQVKKYNEIAFGVLQAARTRITKTEYISCPSCGRTLFDLQETTAMIRKRTDHLKGIKIGIMGCIVNGPGEMADADYGYVGSGKGKITLYKGKEVVKRGVPSAKALDELIELIREDGNWIEPSAEAVN
ncbi:(E)-4-hydroxy-3-methylbut-2-enyl-diphosphate synthase [Marinoscillum sp. MHG1-6]|uniref:(E)-4-hydroxy-3-methylbut-2-enyl-diphosphate synthase n=1 Tax=Marinoscillum sp. MHG1-6 TaxID=2959627 RepID=UPI0021574DEA|nr:(E)-4-hydroxy-3-methylbut-2-enyl-diphosphate synthase [Marinoscillum sp. MHG1-6]